MALFRSVHCNFKDCQKEFTEAVFGDGFPGWGTVIGALVDHKHQIDLCPEHLQMVLSFMSKDE